MAGGDPIAFLRDRDPTSRAVKRVVAERAVTGFVERLARKIRNEIMDGLGG